MIGPLQRDMFVAVVFRFFSFGFRLAVVATRLSFAFLRLVRCLLMFAFSEARRLSSYVVVVRRTLSSCKCPSFESSCGDASYNGVLAGGLAC